MFCVAFDRGRVPIVTGFIRASIAVGLGVLGLQAAAHASAGVDWRYYNGDLQSDRFSPLANITPKNAGDLREVCTTVLGDEGIFEPGPLVIGDTLIVTTVHTVVAVNAADCSVRWRYVYEGQGDEPLPANRGAAYLDGRVFRGTGDGWVLAIDAATGRELWRAKAADPEVGEFFSGAPIAWSGLVYFGPGGSEWGIRGRVAAFDAATGKEVWRFNTVPMQGEPGYETWHIPETAQHGGGGTWTSYTLDPLTRELFVPVGNPAPDFRPDIRPGDNLYTNSMVVLNAENGKLKWYYQFDSNDAFDYDLAAAPTLFTDQSGKRRIAVGSKDGYLYVIDRDTHKLVFKSPVTTVTKPPGPPTPAGIYACPGADGGVQWNGPAYSPATNNVYVGSVDWCLVVRSGPAKYEAPLVFMGTFPNFSSGTGPKTGWIYGLNVSTGKVAWRYHAETPVLSGVTPTAGGVLFSGESSGNLLVFDAKNGTLLKKQNLGGSLGGGVITYSVAGRQYVATTTGNVSRSGLSTGGNSMPTLVILTTGLNPAHQPARAAAAAPEELARHVGADPGKSLFNIFCTGCHGREGKGGEGGPALLNETSRKDVAAIVEWIKNPAPPMPKMSPPLSNAEVESVARYVEQLRF